MEVLLVIMFVFFLFWLKRIRIDYLSKVIVLLFTLYWFLALFLAHFELHGLYVPKKTSVFLLLFSVFSFIVGFISLKIDSNVIRSFDFFTLKNQLTKLVNSFFFKIVLILSNVYLVFLLGQYYARLIFLESMGDLRLEYYQNNLYGSFFSTIDTFFLYPFFLFLLPIFGFCTLYKRNFIWVLLLVFLIVYTSLSGGRINFIKFLLPVILFSIFNTQSKSVYIKKGYKFGLFFFTLLFSILIISYVSAARFGNISLSFNNLKVGFEISTKQIVTYSVGPTVAFDYALEKDYLDQMGGFSFGLLTFNSVENLIYSVVNRFGLNYIRPISTFAELKQNSQIYLSNEFSWNALYTWSLFFYLDFGILGLFVFPFSIGYLFRLIIKKLYLVNSIPYLIILNFLFQVSIFSVMDWSFSSIGVLIFLSFLFLFAKVKLNIEKFNMMKSKKF